MQVRADQEQVNNDIATATTTDASIGEQVLVACPACQANTILFSRTIQTFCFVCGTPITQLDQKGMFYETSVGYNPQ